MIVIECNWDIRLRLLDKRRLKGAKGKVRSRDQRGLIKVRVKSQPYGPRVMPSGGLETRVQRAAREGWKSLGQGKGFSRAAYTLKAAAHSVCV